MSCGTAVCVGCLRSRSIPRSIVVSEVVGGKCSRRAEVHNVLQRLLLGAYSRLAVLEVEEVPNLPFAVLPIGESAVDFR